MAPFDLIGRQEDSDTYISIRESSCMGTVALVARAKAVLEAVKGR